MPKGNSVVTLLDNLLADFGRLAAMVECIGDNQFATKAVPFSIQVNRVPSLALGDARERFATAYERAHETSMRNVASDFLFGMTLVHACSLFERYLVQLLKVLFQKTPRMLLNSKGATDSERDSRKVAYETIIEAAETDESLLDIIIEEQVGRFAYLSCKEQLALLRRRYGFDGLTTDYDSAVVHFALARNCVVHNHSIVDDKLADASRGFFGRNTALRIDRVFVLRAISVFSYMSGAIDALATRKHGPIACELSAKGV
jgi:hypothetical protein